MASPPAAASLKAFEQEYKKGVASLTGAVQYLNRCENILQKQLEEAQRQTQECAGAIDHVFANRSYPTDTLSKQLHAYNAKAFVLESSLKACDEELSAEIQRIDALFQDLVLKRQQNNLRLLQNQLSQRLQTIKLGTPLQLGKIATRLALLAEDLKGYPATLQLSDLKENDLLLSQSGLAAVKKQQEHLWQPEIGRFMAELEMFAKDPPHDCVVWDKNSEAILLPYRHHYTELKKICLEMWNRSIALRIEVETKFALIDSSLKLNISLPELMGKFTQLKDDLETLRHQFKGKNRPQHEKHLVRNRTHLSTKFETLKTTFYVLLGFWKNARPKCDANLKELETQIGKIKGIAAQALEAPHFKQLLEVEVPSWVSLFRRPQRPYRPTWKRSLSGWILLTRWSLIKT